MHGKMKKDSKVKLRAVLEKLAPVEFNQVRYSSSLPCTRKLVGGKCGAPEAAGGNNPVSQPDMSEAETPAAANCNECAVRKTRLVFAVGDVTNELDQGYCYLEEGTLHRVIGWAHPALLQLLLYLRTTLFVDGTFRCVPVPYHQCVVVMCLDNAANCYVPVFYSLAKGLAHATYWDILHILIVATDHQLDPESVTCDYEAALIAVIRDQLPNTTINGCLFHWK
ncbi:hypothetical protein PF006_g7891 [Phytophthora fragariae]|uniref:MULE transposase domain-containing protein n=1 Tax=Phytophthora fragariae TaxID=53985 RepID=A0A6A3U7A0_9STRA|nr:hypothetical protein PF006_g7891 [Phytophthora fragariae]